MYAALVAPSKLVFITHETRPTASLLLPHGRFGASTQGTPAEPRETSETVETWYGWMVETR